MERRSFLTLLASAPIAALAPWSRILEQRPALMFHRLAFEMVMAPLPQRGYLRRASDGEHFVYEVWRPDFLVRITDAHVEID